eukprot:356075-Chlamydomonas_euryale.AAC.1
MDGWVGVRKAGGWWQEEIKIACSLDQKRLNTASWHGCTVQAMATHVSRFLKISCDRSAKTNFHPTGRAWTGPCCLVGLPRSLDRDDSEFYSDSFTATAISGVRLRTFRREGEMGSERET